MTQKRRLLVVAGAVAGAVLIAGVALAALTEDGSPPTTPHAGATTLAGSSRCVVSYAVWAQDNHRFKAAITIANRDALAIRDWKLWFVMPGDQVVSGNGRLKLDQQGRGVTVQSKTVLSPQQTQTLEFTGRYKDSNAAPMVFELGGHACQTFVSPAPGAPSQPVEQLENGTLRLGPAPTRDTPIPGISIDPSGVAVPVPVNTPPAAGGTATTTSPAVIVPPGGGGNGNGNGTGTGNGTGVDSQAPKPPPVDGTSTSPSPTATTTAPGPADTFTDPADSDDETGGDEGGEVVPPDFD
jgi:serine/threonine-protein kinase